MESCSWRLLREKEVRKFLKKTSNSQDSSTTQPAVSYTHAVEMVGMETTAIPHVPLTTSSSACSSFSNKVPAISQSQSELPVDQMCVSLPQLRGFKAKHRVTVPSASAIVDFGSNNANNSFVPDFIFAPTSADEPVAKQARMGARSSNSALVISAGAVDCNIDVVAIATTSADPATELPKSPRIATVVSDSTVPIETETGASDWPMEDSGRMASGQRSGKTAHMIETASAENLTDSPPIRDQLVSSSSPSATPQPRRGTRHNRHIPNDGPDSLAAEHLQAAPMPAQHEKGDFEAAVTSTEKSRHESSSSTENQLVNNACGSSAGKEVDEPIASDTISFNSVRQSKRWSSEGVYSGDLVDGLREGQGRFEFHAHDLYTAVVYEGQWRDDQIQGTGVLKFKIKGKLHTYKGDFVNGDMTGVGEMTYPCGAVYSGHGEFTWGPNSGYQSGNVYLGPFVDNRIEGQGKLTYNNESSTLSVFEGLFVYGAAEVISQNPLASMYANAEGLMCEGKWVKGDLIRQEVADGGMSMCV
eukprot:gene28518-35389_t